MILEANLRTLGDSRSLEAGFEYRVITGQDVNERTGAWTATPFEKRAAAGTFRTRVAGLRAQEVYEFRAAVKHPLIMIYGAEKPVPGK